jgi:hypothetical protein
MLGSRSNKTEEAGTAWVSIAQRMARDNPWLAAAQKLTEAALFCID